MPTLNDPLTVASDALIAFLNTEPLLASGYNWQHWESDVAIQMPRGYITASSDAALIYGHGPIMLHMEAVLEGKPKRGSLTAPMAALVAMINDPNLHGHLNGFISDSSMKFYQQAERVQARQTITGDVRVRAVSFYIAAKWFVIQQ